MGGFTTAAGDAFLHALLNVDTVSMMSIYGCRQYPNEYKVNGRGVFADTIHVELPNLVNYVNLSKQLQVDRRAMLAVLCAFDRMKVNSYHRTRDFDYLLVASGFTPETGYIHIRDSRVGVGSEFPYYGTRLQLKRDIGNGWYEIAATGLRGTEECCIDP